MLFHCHENLCKNYIPQQHKSYNWKKKANQDEIYICILLYLQSKQTTHAILFTIFYLNTVSTIAYNLQVRKALGKGIAGRHKIEAVALRQHNHKCFHLLRHQSL